AVGQRDGNKASFHATEEKRRRAHHFEQDEACFELLRSIADEVRPMTAAGNELVQVAHHLAAVAHAEREGAGTCEERRELVPRPRVEEDRLGPALACAEHVAIGKAATRREANEIRQLT